MNIDNLVHDLRILISTWDDRSNHKKCLGIFLKDKLITYQVKNTKNTISQRRSDELKLKSQSLLKKSYKPTLPSTYVKEKRTSLLKPSPIRIKVSAQLSNVSKVGDYIVIKPIPYDLEEKPIGNNVTNNLYTSNSPSSASEIVKVKPIIDSCIRDCDKITNIAISNKFDALIDTKGDDSLKEFRNNKESLKAQNTRNTARAPKRNKDSKRSMPSKSDCYEIQDTDAKSNELKS